MVTYDDQFHAGVIHGDQQARFTQMRAAYGDVGAAMMAGGGGGGPGFLGGAASGLMNLGQSISPLQYGAPARVLPSQAGYTQQETGFFTGLGATMGMHDTPISTTSTEYHHTAVRDFGERVGMGLATAGTTAVGLGAGIATRTVGAAAGALVGGGIGMFFGGPLGAKVGAAVGSFVGQEATAVLGVMGAGKVMEGVEQRRQIQAMLEQESFRYVGAGSDLADPRLGRGMSSKGRLAAAEMIRDMDVADPDLDTTDLKNIMQGAGRMGLFSGAGQDIESFKRRFKEITDGVKQVASVLHTTLEEGMGVIRDMQQAGVDPSQVQGMVMRADASGMVAGLTGREMVNFGMQGANMFRGTGVDMNIGMQSNMMNLAAVRSARDAGALSEEAIRQAGGEQALAQRMTAGSLSFTQSAQGRGTMALLFDPKTGGLNTEALNALTSGNMTLVEAMQQGARNISSPEDIIKMEANQDKIASAIGQQYGGQGLFMAEMSTHVMQAVFEAEAIGGDPMEHLRRKLVKQGKTFAEADAMIARVTNARGEFTANQKAAQTARDKQIADQSARGNYLYRTGDKIGDVVKNVADYAAEPINELVEDVSMGAMEIYEEQWKGLTRLDTSDIDTRRSTSATLRAMGAGTDVMSADESGFLHQSSGSKILEAIQAGHYGKQGPDLIKTVNPEQMEEFVKKHGPVLVLDKDDNKVILREDMKRLQNVEQTLATSDAEIDKLHKDGNLPDLQDKFNSAMMSGKLTNAKSMTEVIEAVTSENIEDVPEKERLAVMKHARELKDTSKLLDEARDRGSLSANATNTAYITEQRKLKDTLDESAEAFGDAQIGIDDLTAGTFSRMITNRAFRTDLRAAKKKLSGMKPGSAEYKKQEEVVAGIEQQIGRSDAELVKELVNSYDMGQEEALEKHKELHQVFDTEAGDWYFRRGGKLVATLGANMQERGAGMFTKAIELELSKSANLGLDKKYVRAIEDFGQTFGGSLADIKSMSGDTREALKKTAMGQRLLEIGDLSEKIHKGMSHEEVDKRLKELGLGDTERAEAMREVRKGGGQEVLQNILSNTMRDMAGDKGVASAVAASGEGGKIDPFAAYQEQTSINTKVLSILEALEKRLK